MDIDVTALKSLVREKNLSLDLVVETIEAALLVAYQRTDGSAETARVQLDRKSGHVIVWASEVNDEGEVIGEFDDTPEGFGRIAAATARQVLLSRLREAEGEATMTEFSGREGDLVSGVIQQTTNPRMIRVDLGKLEVNLPPGGNKPPGGDLTSTVARIKAIGDGWCAGGFKRSDPSPCREHTRTLVGGVVRTRGGPKIAEGNRRDPGPIGSGRAGHPNKDPLSASNGAEVKRQGDPGIGAKGTNAVPNRGLTEFGVGEKDSTLARFIG
jgi:NusA N-terminal domain.